MSKMQRVEMGIRDLYKVAKCGKGLHIRIPPKIAKAYELETGDEIRVTLHEVKYSRLRE